MASVVAASVLLQGIGDFISSQAEDIFAKNEREREMW
jgi:hypothetical protein